MKMTLRSIFVHWKFYLWNSAVKSGQSGYSSVYEIGIHMHDTHININFLFGFLFWNVDIHITLFVVVFCGIYKSNRLQKSAQVCGWSIHIKIYAKFEVYAGYKTVSMC